MSTKISFVASRSPDAEEAKALLTEKYDSVAIDVAFDGLEALGYEFVSPADVLANP